MPIKINGKDLKDAVIKTDQFEIRISEIAGDTIKMSVKDVYGEAFTFVPRFFRVVYPDKTTIAAKDVATIPVPTSQTIEHALVFQSKLKLDKGTKFRLVYGFGDRKLADISVE